MIEKEEKKIRDDTSQKTAEQSPDILLLANTKTKHIRVASKEEGKTDRFDKINHENLPFLSIDKASILENFLSNYFRQGKDPTHFRFFKAPLDAVKSVSSFIRDIFNEVPSDDINDFMDEYEVKPVIQANKKENEVKKENENHQNLKENKMDTVQETKTHSAAAETPANQRYTENMIDWETIGKFGISRDILEKKGALKDLLAGRKTEGLFTVKANFGKVVLDMQARLSLRKTPEGVALAVHGVRKQPELDKPFYGHIFSDEDRKNLKETGHMGRLAHLSYRGSDEKTPCYISLDPFTNETLAANAQKVNIPEVICGVELSEKEITDLKEGRKIHVDGMVSPSTGKEFNADLQVSADKYGLQFSFEKGLVTSLGNVKLTKQQVEAYNSGKTIFLEDMQRKGGEKFSSFITRDSNGNPMYTRYNPQSPEGAREIYIPKVINNVALSKDEFKTLQRGAPIYLDGMTTDRGEEFSRFVKVDLESGRIMYSDKENGFNERPEFKIPQELYGHKFSAEERAFLQDGKTLHLTDLKGFEKDKEKFSSYVNFNHRMGHFDFPKEHPDNPKKTETTAQTAAPEVKQQPETPKSATRQTAKKDEKQNSIKDANKQEKKAGFTKKAKLS